MDKRLLRTEFAARAATLADQFQHAVEDYPVAQHRGQMTAPEASTAGGVQSLQHIRLVPPEGGGRIYVVGNANRRARTAELRTLEYVDLVSLERFDERTGLDPAAYTAFLDVAQQFLEMFGLTVTRVGLPTGSTSRHPRLSPERQPGLALSGPMVTVGVVVLIGFGVWVGLMVSHMVGR